MTDYMLASALQQSLLHALTQLLELLTGCPWLEAAHPQTLLLQPASSFISTTLSLPSGQPAPVLSWQTGKAGAQPLPLMSLTTGLPNAQLQQSFRSSRTTSLPSSATLQPWIDMSLLLNGDGDDLVFRPPVADFVRHFDNMLRDLPNTIAVVHRLVTHPELEVCSCVYPTSSTKQTCLCKSMTSPFACTCGQKAHAVKHVGSHLIAE